MKFGSNANGDAIADRAQERLNESLASQLPRLLGVLGFTYIVFFLVQKFSFAPPVWASAMWFNLATGLCFVSASFSVWRRPVSPHLAHPVVAAGAVLMVANILLRDYLNAGPPFISVLLVIGLAVTTRSARWFFGLTTGVAMVLAVVGAALLNSVNLAESAGVHGMALLVASLLFYLHHRNALQSEIRSIQLEHRTRELLAANKSLELQIEQHNIAVRQLAASEERYRHLVEFAPLPILIRRGEEIVFANQAVLKMLGLTSVEDILRRSAMEFVLPEDRDEFMKRYKRIEATGEVVTSEFFRYQRDDGRVIEVEVSSTGIQYEGQPARLVMGMDITGTRAAERQMRVLQTAADSSLEGIVLCDHRGYLTYLNDRGLELLGEPYREGVIGRHSSHYFERRTEARAVTNALMEGGSWLGETSVVTRQGLPRPVKLSAHLVRDRDGTPIALMGLFQDVSKEVSLRQRLIAERERAELASRTKSLFLSSMSHELRTPLNGVIGFSELLLSAAGEALDDRRMQYVGYIHRSGLHLLELISDLLDLGKIDSGALELKKGPIPVEALIRECFAMVDSVARDHNVSLCKEPCPKLCIEGDHRRCRQILLNLLTNAIYYGGAGSEVWVRISTASPGSIRIMVTDRGPGIAPDDVANIFDEFKRLEQTAQRNPDGSGIGLTLVKRLVTIQGGAIGVDTTLGQGSTFWFELPVSGQPSVEALDAVAEDSTESVGPFGQTLRVLVAEDNEANMFLIREFIAGLGHTMYEARDGQEAIDLALALRPDVILMDVSMPVMDGLAATRELRRKGGVFVDLPIVALTAHADGESIERSMEAGCTIHVTKPVHFATLGSVLKNYAPQKAGKGPVFGGPT